MLNDLYETGEFISFPPTVSSIPEHIFFATLLTESWREKKSREANIWAESKQEITSMMYSTHNWIAAFTQSALSLF